MNNPVQTCSDSAVPLSVSHSSPALTQQSHSQSHTAVPLSVLLSSPALTQQSHSQSHSAVPLSLSSPTLTQQSHSHSALPLSVSLSFSSPTLTQQSHSQSHSAVPFSVSFSNPALSPTLTQQPLYYPITIQQLIIMVITWQCSRYVTTENSALYWQRTSSTWGLCLKCFISNYMHVMYIMYNKYQTTCMSCMHNVYQTTYLYV